MAREFDNVLLGGKNNSKATGKLKVADVGIGWRNSLNGKIVAVPAGDIHKVTWQRCARDYQLRVQQKDGTVSKFDGLPKEMYDTLAPLLKNLYHKTLERKESSVKGWNWGAIEFQGNHMAFNVANHTAFEIPLSEVANTNVPSKHEVTVEFATPETSGDSGSKRKAFSEDALVEVRFFVPGVGTQNQVTANEEGVKVFKDKDQEAGDENAEDGQEDGEEPALDGDGAVLSSANLLCETIKAKSDFGGGHGEPVASFENILCLTPRGRFEVELHEEFFRLRGKSHDYKIMYSSIIVLSLLPKPDDLHHMFVIGLDPPLRQGQTRYPFLVFQFEKEEEVELDINMEDATFAERSAQGLQKSYDGPVYDVVSGIMSALTGKKITEPVTFKSSQGQSGIKCAHKANEAFLYPLEKSILSIPKPPIFLAQSEIAAVTFSRVGQTGGSALKTFEIKFNLRSGPEYTFGSIAREEYEPLESFFRAKKIKVLNEMADATPGYIEDSDGGSENEGGTRKRSRADNVDAFGDEDEDSSEDEDFAPEDESDVGEEFDENYGGSESEGEGGEKKEGDGGNPSDDGRLLSCQEDDNVNRI
ncbi:hypothetical protein DFJ77DRAFT_368693 [Powellomyces hirtus]|nr:hypothetical protein DFJ77DRAFT_368693 [Powellomyces hirtus]